MSPQVVQQLNTNANLDCPTQPKAAFEDKREFSGLSNRAAQIAVARGIIEMLAEHWPQCFFVYQKRRKPLKLGVHCDVLAALDGAVTPRDLSAAFRHYCGNVWYLRACRPGVSRIDLEGNAVGTVTDEEAKNAAAVLAARAAKRQNKMQAQASAIAAGPKPLSL
ncbi:MAG TPA: ProQ/FINO family protein, partial [Xanthobacteraceae bacterium]|nr:ProQ/FINO family protein [Xanthobacteraceae bacterium]